MKPRALQTNKHDQSFQPPIGVMCFVGSGREPKFLIGGHARHSLWLRLVGSERGAARPYSTVEP